MKYMLKLRILKSIALCLIVFSQVTYGQTYSFRNYGTESNIPNGFIYTIQQSDDGFLWVGTGSGIARFDGYNFFNVTYPDSSLVRYPTSSFKDKNGTIWFGCNDGTLFHTRNNRLVQVKLLNEKIISGIASDATGLIYIVPQGKAVFSIDPDHPEKITRFNFPGDQIIYSVAAAGKHRLLIGTQEKILICTAEKDTLNITGSIEGFDNTAVTAVLQAGDSTEFVAGTDGNGLFRLHLSEGRNELSRFSNHPELEALTVQSLSIDTDKNIWAATFGAGVLELGLSESKGILNFVRSYSLSSGTSTDLIKRVFQDSEGNYWFGTYGEGLSMLTSYAFGYYSLSDNPARKNVIYVSSFKDKFLLGTISGFHLFDKGLGKSISFTDLTRIAENTEITSYLLDNKGVLWIGTGGNGLFIRDNSGSVRRFFRSGDSGIDFIKDIKIAGNDIWLATTNGVVVVDLVTAREKKRFDISNGLPHNSINSIMTGPDGLVYIGTECDRLYTIDKNYNVRQGSAIMAGSTINKVQSFARSTNGDIWAATKSNGLFRFRNDSVTVINRANALMSNYCFSILADDENNIWAGHEKGFSRYNPDKGSMRVYGADFVKAGVCNPMGMYESADKEIFIGTTDGLIIYDLKKDKKVESAPLVNINYITINDTRFNYQSAFSLPYSKKNVIRIEYSGINFRNPGKVYYSTFLENYDNDWSKLTTSREVQYNLRDGKYRFRVIAVNEDGVTQEKEAVFNIFIHQPFWRTWWFILLSIAVVSGIVVIIVREREKAQKKIQDYLEKELDARTAVVMQQKGEIEMQNMEITDSITYAKRIQSSILPDITKLKESFSDAFILFQPRDIVSGDFYWFDRLDDDRFILVCADSTGHGVPGAFMSMIGSTLLQDIVTRKRVSKPSEVLNMLDRQIFSTLNQNVELGVSNDGMDMVVCEFNIKRRHIRFASAMRPVILLIGNESFYIKGNRSSIGGETLTEKYFDDQEYYLGENDSIYLFSDGLSDQFGGSDGKKMKIAKLRKLIEEVAHLPMDEQKVLITNFYTEWKGSYDQVDDILLMGVRV
jgi:ligand-binding sensor domain-containing protein/serine phosphatase RsbU (regulator of sigma subunit)